MCRFLLAEGASISDPTQLINSFSAMAEKSSDPDGGRQGDGCGFAFYTDQGWHVQTSLLPVWEASSSIAFPDNVQQLLIHARSASFDHQKGVLAYNQPYVNEQYAFVFNGIVEFRRGKASPAVTTPALPDKPRGLSRYKGEIGAQKLWALLQEQLQKYSPLDALEATAKLVNSWSHNGVVRALNMGLADGEHMYAYTQFADNSTYYNMQVYRGTDLSMFCSESLQGFDFTAINPRQVVALSGDKP